MKSDLRRMVISLSITLLVITIAILKDDVYYEGETVVNNDSLLAVSTIVEYNVEDDVKNFIENNKTLFDFYTNLFGISLEDLTNVIIEANTGVRFNELDIFNTQEEYDSLDKDLLINLLALEKTNSNLFNRTCNSGISYSKEYIYGLVSYFSLLYGNVDFETLAAIAYIESGNLSSNYMLSANNIYGGMSGGSLIRHDTIEYGVLSYVRMMSEKYYGKGLTTISKIAQRYNLGSQTWINNVTAMKKKFANYTYVTNVEQLMELK